MKSLFPLSAFWMYGFSKPHSAWPSCSPPLLNAHYGQVTHTTLPLVCVILGYAFLPSPPENSGMT
jgi:hypothetical protein